MLGFERISAKLVEMMRGVRRYFLEYLLIYDLIIYQILNQGNGDIIAINQKTYLDMDWWIAQLHFFILYCIVGATNSYFIEVVHVWMCPSISSWVIARGFFGSSSYIVNGRFRVLARNRLLWNRYSQAF